ncbi:BRO-N domain-containing protein [Corynebacterium sp. A21]|uniref:BRO-N domain-containing protein n=1 Tax=Corynebacterium sp. A21 TaxID=3457318 RepID=UPI003FCFBE19
MTKEGQPWFVLSDLAKVMGIGNVTELKKRLDQHGFSQTEVTDSIGRKQKQIAVNKANMYRVIMRSDKAEEVSMIQRSEKGNQARRYFIEMEKAYKETPTL